jgi:hypothetical protein
MRLTRVKPPSTVDTRFIFSYSPNGDPPFNRLLKNTHLLRFPHPSPLRRTLKKASFLRISGALHLGIFEQPEESPLFHQPINT